MTQATLTRRWVVFTGTGLFTLGMAYGLFALGQHAPALLARANAAVVEVPPLRGAIRAADGTPVALSTGDESRVHPLGLSMTQVVGFGERSNGKGLEGLERDLEDSLSRGQDIRMTLQPGAQAIAERALWRGVAAAKADWGTALVMEASTGRLLAVANGPSFDPTARRGSLARNVAWRNHAFGVPLEPGSTMKALTAAALMEEGAVSLQSRVYAPMYRQIAGWTINDIVKHPETLTLSEVLKYSSNVGISRLAERVSRKQLYGYFQKLHLTSARPMDAVKVAPPNVRPPERWGPLEYANATFGQGFLVTPLHLTAAFNALANDGVYQRPVLLEGQVSRAEKVFSPQTARDIRLALTNGAAEAAKIKGYALGGKTGTAQVVVEGQRGYSPTVYTALFAGFVPADKPKVTVVVVLHYPKGGRIHGSQVAAPVYREIAAGLLAEWGYAPKLDKARPAGKLVNR